MKRLLVTVLAFWAPAAIVDWGKGFVSSVHCECRYGTPDTLTVPTALEAAFRDLPWSISGGEGGLSQVPAI